MPDCRPSPLRVAIVLSLIVVGAALGAATSGADLNSRLSGVHQREGALKSSINADNTHISGFQGHINDLQAHITALQNTIDAEQAALAQTQAALRGARARLFVLRGRLAHDKQVLAAELVARYESDPPDIITVLFNARGFADLLETVDALKRVGQQNTQITKLVSHAKTAVHQQTVRYTQIEAQQERQTSAVLVQRDEVAQIKFVIVQRQEKYIQARNRKSALFATVHARALTLEKELAQAQARAAAAQAQAFNATGTATPPATIGSFTAARRFLRLLPVTGHELRGRRRARDRLAPRRAGQGAASASDRPVGLPHATALRRGGRVPQ